MLKQKIIELKDNVAENSDWYLLNTSATNFDLYKLVYVGDYYIKYRLTWFARSFFSVFVIVGIIIFIHFLNNSHESALLPCSIIFILFGVVPYYFTSAPIVFDKDNNIFFKGRNSAFFNSYIKINLIEIYALQLIGGCFNSDDYNTYQVNLINKESKRINVTYYSNIDKARKDAKILQEFLNTKLWDVV